jgi:hypothetical protein
MIVAFYPISNASFDLSSGQVDLNINYSNPIEVREMEFIPGIKSIIELDGELYSVQGAETVRYENMGNETILYACHVNYASNYPTMTLPYSHDFDNKLKAVMRKKKIRGILD